CAPPLRIQQEQESLWQHLLAGHIDLIASDHSPSPLFMKQSPGFFQVWGGIAGVQSMLPIMLVEGHLQRALALSEIAKLLSTHVARRYKIAGKGRIAPGYDADLVFVNPTTRRSLSESNLHYRHKISPYLGLPIDGLIRRTILGGQTIYCDNAFFPHHGRLVKPSR
ncbi:MAG TPA: amidohydrolase family protein, partial [Tepidisphaeraceae bacterium]|nr:amidohydrolase family protein [Tepidisphaeraceae bacterium]